MLRFLATLLLAFGAHAAPAPIAWSPGDHSQSVTVSGAATRIPGGGAYQGCRSDTAQSKGVRFVTFPIVSIGAVSGVTGPGLHVGLGNGKTSLTQYLGWDNYGVGFYYNGNVLKNGAWTGVSLSPYTTGDVIGMKVDFTARTVAFNKNGGTYSATVDITSLGPELYAMCSLGNGVSPSVQIADTNWNDFPWPTIVVNAHGDSITLTGGVMQTYHPRLLALIEASRAAWASGYHFGINGDSWDFAWVSSGMYPATLISDAVARVDTARSPVLPSYLIAFAGTNGFALAGHSAAQEYTHFTQYLTARISAGWEPSKIIVCTMLPRPGVLEQKRIDYNAMLVAGASTYGYHVARLDLATVTMQADNVHPDDNGHQTIADVIFAVIQPLITAANDEFFELAA